MNLIAKAHFTNAGSKIQPEANYFKCSNYLHLDIKNKLLLNNINRLSIFSKILAYFNKSTPVYYTCVDIKNNYNKGTICKN